MRFAEYWSPEGRLVVYFHGALGAIEESSVFDESAKANRLRALLQKTIAAALRFYIIQCTKIHMPSELPSSFENTLWIIK